MYEKSLLENNSEQLSLNLKDPKEMGEALRQYSQELKSLITEKDKLDEVIANFKRSLEQLPGNEAITQQINIQGDNKIRVLANIESHAMKSIEVIDSLINLYEKLKKKYQIEIGKFEKFFVNFNDSIVLIGPEERTFMDLAPTPMDNEPIPKVSVHGNVIKTLSSEIFIKRMFDTKEASSLLIFMLCLVSAALSSHSSSWTSWVGILVLGGFVLLGVFLFLLIILSFLWPLLHLLD